LHDLEAECALLKVNQKQGSASTTLIGRVQALEEQLKRLETSCSEMKGSQIRSRRKPQEAKLQRSEGATRSEPRQINWGNADPSKWKYVTTEFNGGYTHFQNQKVELEKVSDLITSGMQKLKSSPGKYEGYYYQTDMTSWPDDQQKYNMVKRTGSGFKLGPGRGFSFYEAKFQALPPNVVIQPDAYTNKMNYQGCKLPKALSPGRGEGVADIPNLKVIGDADPNDIRQGGVGDCWLLCSISALAEYDSAIEKMFRKTANLREMPRESANQYTITLYDIVGQPPWRPVDITVDERLCMKSDGSGLLGNTPSLSGELWVCYLEKAIAAHCGGWDKIDGGTPIHGWRLLTGFEKQYTFRSNREGFQCFGMFNPNTNSWEKMANSPRDCATGLYQMDWPKVGGGGDFNLTIDQTQMFERMCAWHDSNFMMALGTKSGTDSEDTDGIVDGHAYTVLDCINDAGGTSFDMIKVRNPWGQGEFTIGQWDDDGPGWTKYPKVKEACKPVKANDGVFWMEKEEFFKYFPTLYLCAHDMSEFLK